MDFGNGSASEYHADPHPHLDRVHVRIEYVGVVRVEHDVAFIAVARVKIVHAVEAPQIVDLPQPRCPISAVNFFS